MIGYTSAKMAKALGCTHHGSYYGIPIWLGDLDSEAPLAFAKWEPLELLIELASYIEALLFPIAHGPEARPMFRLKVKDEIE